MVVVYNGIENGKCAVLQGRAPEQGGQLLSRLNHHAARFEAQGRILPDPEGVMGCEVSGKHDRAAWPLHLRIRCVD